MINHEGHKEAEHRAQELWCRDQLGLLWLCSGDSWNLFTPEFERREKEKHEKRQIDRDVAKDDHGRGNCVRVRRGNAQSSHIQQERQNPPRVQIRRVINFERGEDRRQKLRSGEIPKEMADVIDARAVECLERIPRENDQAKPVAASREH